MGTKYHTNSHSKYLIKLHFVFAVKYRKNLIHDIIKNDLIEIMTDICLQKKYTIDAIQSDGDHIHILLDIQPIVSAYEVAHQLKQISTYRIYKKHSSFLKKHFWKENIFWSDGFLYVQLGIPLWKLLESISKNKGNNPLTSPTLKG